MENHQGFVGVGRIVINSTPANERSPNEICELPFLTRQSFACYQGNYPMIGRLNDHDDADRGQTLLYRLIPTVSIGLIGPSNSALK